MYCLKFINILIIIVTLSTLASFGGADTLLTFSEGILTFFNTGS